MNILQHRLQEETSAVMNAAEGENYEVESPEWLLAKDIELSGIIKYATEERERCRKLLKEQYEETGNRPVVGDVQYQPRVTTKWDYSLSHFMDTMGDDAAKYLAVDGTKVNKAIEIGLIEKEVAAGFRTATESITHGTGKVKE